MVASFVQLLLVTYNSSSKYSSVVFKRKLCGTLRGNAGWVFDVSGAKVLLAVLSGASDCGT